MTYNVQSSIKLADVGLGEQPTGSISVLEDSVSPLVLLGMSGGTLLVMAREFDEGGYTWTCVKRFSLPSCVFRFRSPVKVPAIVGNEKC